MRYGLGERRAVEKRALPHGTVVGQSGWLGWGTWYNAGSQGATTDTWFSWNTPSHTLRKPSEIMSLKPFGCCWFLTCNCVLAVCLMRAGSLADSSELRASPHWWPQAGQEGRKASRSWVTNSSRHTVINSTGQQCMQRTHWGCVIYGTDKPVIC